MTIDPSGNMFIVEMGVFVSLLGALAGVKPAKNPLPDFVRLPASGVGYYTYAHPSKLWGTKKLVQFLQTLASTYVRRVNYAVVEIGIGEMSLRSGKAYAPHKYEHKSGNEVDLRPIRRDVTAQGTNYHARREYDFFLTQVLVDVIHEVGGSELRKIVFNDQNVAGEKVRHEKPHLHVHDNHLHVGLEP